MGGFRARALVTMFGMTTIGVISIALARSNAPAASHASASMACVCMTVAYLITDSGGSLSVERNTSNGSGATISLQLHGGPGRPNETGGEALWPSPSSGGASATENHRRLPMLAAGSYYSTSSDRSAATSEPPASPTSSVVDNLEPLRMMMDQPPAAALRRSVSRGGRSGRSSRYASVAGQW